MALDYCCLLRIFRPSYDPATCIATYLWKRAISLKVKIKRQMPMVFLSYEIAYHMCDNNTCCFGCNVILIGFSFFFPVFSKAKNKLLSFVSMCLQHSNSDITGISVVRETTRYQSDVSNSQAHVNTEEFNLSWNLHCR